MNEKQKNMNFKLNSALSIHNSSFKRLGDYIQLVDKCNTDSKITLLRGVSTRKVLIESVANMTRVSLHNYKIVGHNQFVYVADTSRRAEKIGLALNDAEPCIVSSVCTTFEVKNKRERDVLID